MSLKVIRSLTVFTQELFRHTQLHQGLACAARHDNGCPVLFGEDVYGAGYSTVMDFVSGGGRGAIVFPQFWDGQARIANTLFREIQYRRSPSFSSSLFFDESANKSSDYSCDDGGSPFFIIRTAVWIGDCLVANPQKHSCSSYSANHENKFSNLANTSIALGF